MADAMDDFGSAVNDDYHANTGFSIGLPGKHVLRLPFSTIQQIVLAAHQLYPSLCPLQLLLLTRMPRLWRRGPTRRVVAPRVSARRL